MAVKQNNTETNGAGGGGQQTSGGAGNGAGGGANPGGGGGIGVNGGTMINKMSSHTDIGSIEQPGCSGTGSSSSSSSSSSSLSTSSLKKGKSKISSEMGIDSDGMPSHLDSLSDGSGNGGSSNTSCGSGSISGMTSSELVYILQLIQCAEMQQDQQRHGRQMVYIYQHLIQQLACVPQPRQSPDDLKRFKDDITKVGEFLGKAPEKYLYRLYLPCICRLITESNDSSSPSCAIAVIFQLFRHELIFDAVQSLLVQTICDEDIKKTVHLLCDWMRICNFCQNLNLWIMAILQVLQQQQKLTLYTEIAVENVEQLMLLMILPVLRPKVSPIVFIMLMSINHTHHVFHKILPKLPRVLASLKQQTNNNKNPTEMKTFIKQLVDVTRALMVHFYGYDDLYAPVECALKDVERLYNYTTFTTNTKETEENVTDVMLHSSNAKVGLVNLGNTCYMNSVLQALAMTKEFSREILMSQSHSPLVVKMQQQIALMLYSSRFELTPSRVLNATRPPGFAPGLQQDSSEFLGYLLETLHEQEVLNLKMTTATTTSQIRDIQDEDDQSNETSTVASKTDGFKGSKGYVLTTNTSCTSPVKGGGGSLERLDDVCDPSIVTSGDAIKDPAKNTTALDVPAAAATSASAIVRSTIDKTFTGQLATTYKCLTCGWKSRNVDNFRDLQLSFPEVKGECASNYSVQDLIDYYCSPEKLDGENQYFCERCQRLCDAERYINVITAPKNLILTLKHFKYDQKFHMRAKLMHKVFHDEKVTVKVCSATTMDEVATVHYDLYAGVVHSGYSMDSGHYYTYASDASNRWFKFNDNIVTSSRSEELHNLEPPNTPYILFYQMSAQSFETPNTATDLISCGNHNNNNNLIKVDIPMPLLLEDLPHELRAYVDNDNAIFTEELKQRHFKTAMTMKSKNINKRTGGYRDDDDEDDLPPPASGCGDNAMNINLNRFVF